eukprot:360779-Chlamydomonas_euryale.AAC.4
MIVDRWDKHNPRSQPGRQRRAQRRRSRADAAAVRHIACAVVKILHRRAALEAPPSPNSLVAHTWAAWPTHAWGLDDQAPRKGCTGVSLRSARLLSALLRPPLTPLPSHFGRRPRGRVNGSLRSPFRLPIAMGKKRGLEGVRPGPAPGTVEAAMEAAAETVAEALGFIGDAGLVKGFGRREAAEAASLLSAALREAAAAAPRSAAAAGAVDGTAATGGEAAAWRVLPAVGTALRAWAASRPAPKGSADEARGPPPELVLLAQSIAAREVDLLAWTDARTSGGGDGGGGGAAAEGGGSGVGEAAAAEGNPLVGADAAYMHACMHACMHAVCMLSCMHACMLALEVQCVVRMP